MIYGKKAVDRIWEKNISKVHHFVNKLQAQTGFYDYSHTELMQEACMLFHKRFEDYYEADEQYLRFLFVAVKNHIRNLQLKTYTRNNRFSTNFLELKSVASDEGVVDYMTAWNNVCDPKNIYRAIELNDLIEKSSMYLNELGNEIVLMLCEGVTVKGIAENKSMKIEEVKNIINKSIKPILIELGLFA